MSVAIEWPDQQRLRIRLVPEATCQTSPPEPKHRQGLSHVGGISAPQVNRRCFAKVIEVGLPAPRKVG